jgi:4-azaleucine resistance transporter AzlC
VVRRVFACGFEEEETQMEASKTVAEHTEERAEKINTPRLTTFSWKGVVEGARRTVPVALGIFAYGLVFGVLARQMGLSPFESLVMSGTVFAGASQFAALGLWVAPLPIVAIVLTTLVVNLRHLLMGAALRPRMASLRGWQKYLSLFFMSDESWALTMGQFARGGNNGAFLLGSGLVAFVAWLSATVGGQSLGSALRDPSSIGLDFAFTAVFIGLLLGFWKGRDDLLPWGIAALVAVLAAWWLPGKWYILLGGVAGSIVGALRSDA